MARVASRWAALRRSLVRAGGDGLLAAFGVFTLLCNLAVWQGLGLDRLVVATVGAGAVALAIGLRRAGSAPAAVPAPPDAALQPLSTSWRMVALAAAGVAVVGAQGSGGLAWYWGVASLSVFALGWAAFVPAAREPAAPAVSVEPSAGSAVLVACGLGMALLVTFFQRSDADDAFYVNLAVAALDAPAAPLLAGDSLHGLTGVPMSLPVFGVLSFELAAAVIARVSGQSALFVLHGLVPPLVAFTIPFAYARILRLLLPDRWRLATLFVLLSLVLVGDGAGGLGDFGLLRLQQGKAALLHVALPLLLAQGLEFGAAPGIGRWLRLALSQAAAVGLSTTALWLAPAVATLGCLAAMPWPRPRARRGESSPAGSRESWRTPALTLLAVVASAAHPLGLALGLRAETVRRMNEAVHPLDGLSLAGSELVARSMEYALGAGPSAWLTLFCVIAAVAWAPTSVGRRCFFFFGCAFLAFWNPWSAPIVAAQLTGADTYFRVFWLLPGSLVVATVLTAPASAWRPGAAASTRAASLPSLVTGAALAALLGLLSGVYTLSAENGARFGWPAPRIPRAADEVGRQLVSSLPDRGFVLAPTAIARWLPLRQSHPFPLMVRDMYLDVLYAQLGPAELDRRRILSRMVGGDLRPRDGGEILERAIADYPLQAVVLTGRALSWPELREALRRSPLRVSQRTAAWEIWLRAPE